MKHGNNVIHSQLSWVDNKGYRAAWFGKDEDNYHEKKEQKTNTSSPHKRPKYTPTMLSTTARIKLNSRIFCQQPQRPNTRKLPSV